MEDQGQSPDFDPPMYYALWDEADQRFRFQDFDNGGVQVTVAEHAALFDAQSLGAVITKGEDGRPVAVFPNPPA